MKTGIIIVLCLAIFMFIVMLVCTYKVKAKITEQFRCKHCLKINNILKSKCEYCREGMQKGYVYKSTFFGHRDCKNEQGYIDMGITIKHIKKDILMWIMLICMGIVGIICAILFI